MCNLYMYNLRGKLYLEYEVIDKMYICVLIDINYGS